MKKCPKCGKSLNDYSLFCTECGTKVSQIQETPKSKPPTKKCPKCGANVNSYSSFCSECGTNINQALVKSNDTNKINKDVKSTDKSPLIKILTAVILVLIAIIVLAFIQIFNYNQKSNDTSTISNNQLENSPLQDTSTYIPTEPITSMTTPMTTTITSTITTTTITTTTTTITTTTTTEKPKPKIDIPEGTYYASDIEGMFLMISGTADDVTINIRCNTYGSGGYCPYDLIEAHGFYNYDTKRIEYSNGTLKYIDPDTNHESITSKNESGYINIGGSPIYLTFKNSGVSDGRFDDTTFKMVS